MKILYLCFGSEHYIDTWGYQQNLLPLYHSKIGNDIVVLASNDTYPKFLDSNIISSIKAKGNEYYNGQVKVIRSNSYFRNFIHFQKAKGLLNRLIIEKPDYIFFHGCFNLSILSCFIYKRLNPSVLLVVDNHGDNFNINPSKFYRFIFLKLIWRNIHRFIAKKVDLYYGVTISRCNLLSEYLKIEKSKIKLLPIGADSETYDSIKYSKIELRTKYSMNENDIIIIHGGKLNKRKGTIDLINAYSRLKMKRDNLKLILFGKIEDIETKSLITEDIIFFEWLSRIQIFELFKLADLAVWPIHHTTLIEDAVASKLPFLIRKTETTKHLLTSDFYLNVGDESELYEKINYYFSSDENQLIQNNIIELFDKINYYNIARQSANLI